MKMKEMLQVSQLYVTSLECVHAQTWRLLSVIWFGGCLKARPCQGMPNDIHNLIVLYLHPHNQHFASVNTA